MKLKLRRTCLRGIFAIALVLFSLYNFAQQSAAVSVIKGKVTDAQNNEPLPGVSVGINGSAMGLTDKDGNYSVSAAATAILTFSYIGYKSIEISAGNQPVINIKLHALAGQL